MMERKNFHPSRRFSPFRSVFDGVSAVALFFLFYNQEEFLRNKFLRSALRFFLPSGASETYFSLRYPWEDALELTLPLTSLFVLVLVDIVSAAANAMPSMGRYPPFKREVVAIASAGLDVFQNESHENGGCTS